MGDGPEVRDRTEQINIRCSQTYGSYRNYKDTVLVDFATQSKNVNTNVLDVLRGGTYAVPGEVASEYYNKIEACRKEKVPMGVAERQAFGEGSAAVVNSGLMLDFDIYMNESSPNFSDAVLQKMAAIVVSTVLDVVEPAASDLAGVVTFCTVRPKTSPVQKDGRNMYKTGVHILAPALQISTGTKKYVIRLLKDNAEFLQSLASIGQSGPPEEAIDANAASVPVFLFGSCKPNGLVYDLHCAYRVVVDGQFRTVSQIRGDDLERYNLVAEMSLLHEARYADQPPLVRKAVRECRSELAYEIQDLASRTHNNVTGAEEMFRVSNELSAMAMIDPDVRTLQEMLDVLDARYCQDRNLWRDVVYAIANTSPKYKTLAVWFSQKCPEKWADGGEAELDKLWNDAFLGRRPGACARTKASIMHWARESNPARFHEIIRKGPFNLFLNWVFTNEGVLTHNMIGRVIHAMYGHKYAVDVVDSGKQEKYSWYEFVVPTDPMKPGEVWKWRKEAKPDFLYDAISRLPKTMIPDALGIIDRDRKDAGVDGNAVLAKYHENIYKTLKVNMKKLGDRTFRYHTVTDAEMYFRRRGFIDQIDADGDLLGVGNGVLRLGVKCQLIDHFHEHVVVRHTPCLFRPFDPERPTPEQLTLLRSYACIIPEPDARERILMLMSTGLFGGLKEPVMMIIDGEGSNGKTFMIYLMKNMLGDSYATKLPITILTAAHEMADRPNSAYMRLKKRRLAYFEESDKVEHINTARLKEIINNGEGTGSEKFERQESFEMTATCFLFSNNPLVINTTDHGTWRRLWKYNAKVKFVESPDPGDVYAKKVDKRYAEQYVNDRAYLEANLSIMVYYYEKLQRLYGGNIRKVPSPTIDRETEIYRNQQDVTNQFVSEKMVLTADPNFTVPLKNVVAEYAGWLARRTRGANEISVRPVMSSCWKQIENSALQKHVKIIEPNEPLISRNSGTGDPNANKFLIGCRVLVDPDHDVMAAGERAMSAQKIELPSVEVMLASQNTKWWLFPEENPIIRFPSISEGNRKSPDQSAIGVAPEFLRNSPMESDSKLGDVDISSRRQMSAPVTTEEFDDLADADINDLLDELAC